MKPLILSLTFACLFLGSDLSADPVLDYFENRPDYLLKEGTEGSPRTDVTWVRVKEPESSIHEGEAVLELSATVLSSYDAVNLMSHTEYIAEVTLPKDNRPILKEDLFVIHSDRWNDLMGDETNPYKIGSVIKIEVYGDLEDTSTLSFILKEIIPNQSSHTTPASAPR
ncbi:hypothetical protein [Pelagicoccus sp. SDUM812003]|uniref:hypothetical protein n=1 Tax=Pelagicoccus sp. SDUM812003 TaxID=3041267 RepID=UPI00280CC014|nr:hypothetical protein [Pelagicoccus sp. SDUM812003]MDQ8205773.1 hypothetical protein [Pelagicoccus sp. SDUM812003]